MQDQLVEQTVATTQGDEQDEQLQALKDALAEVEAMLAKVMRNLGDKTGTSGDFCRLVNMKVDLRNTLATRNIKEIEATWVDPEYLKN